MTYRCISLHDVMTDIPFYPLARAPADGQGERSGKHKSHTVSGTRPAAQSIWSVGNGDSAKTPSVHHRETGHTVYSRTGGTNDGRRGDEGPERTKRKIIMITKKKKKN